MKIYKSFDTGVLMTPVKETQNGVMFYECDANGVVTYAPRAWNNNPTPCRQAFYITNPIERKVVELSPEQLTELKK